MITRTIKSTTVNAMICDTASATVYTKEVAINGTFKSFEKGGDAWKYVNELNSWKATEIVVKVEFVGVTEKLYGISEEDFMKYAKELPPRKVYEQNEQ